MTTTTINQNKNLATAIHLSVFSKYIIPLGNFIFPMLLWLTKREDKFVDHHGRNALNFQISMFLYSVLIVSVAVASLVYFGLKVSLNEPYFMENGPGHLNDFTQAIPFITIVGIFGILLLALFVLELFAVINASIKASEGQLYNYPLTINFISSGNTEESNHQSIHQSENEQFNSTKKETL